MPPLVAASMLDSLAHEFDAIADDVSEVEPEDVAEDPPTAPPVEPPYKAPAQSAIGWLFGACVANYWQALAHENDTRHLEDDAATFDVAKLASDLRWKAESALLNAVLLYGKLPLHGSGLHPLKHVHETVSVRFGGDLYIATPTEDHVNSEPGDRDEFDDVDVMQLIVIPVGSIVNGPADGHRGSNGPYVPIVPRSPHIQKPERQPKLTPAQARIIDALKRHIALVRVDGSTVTTQGISGSEILIPASLKTMRLLINRGLVRSTITGEGKYMYVLESQLS